MCITVGCTDWGAPTAHACPFLHLLSFLSLPTILQLPRPFPLPPATPKLLVVPAPGVVVAAASAPGVLAVLLSHLL